MKDLIEALQILSTLILSQFQDYPTYCEHEVLYVYGIDWNKAKFSDVKRLIKLGFYPGFDEDLSFLYELFGNNFDWDELTEEQWNNIEKEFLHTCSYSYKYGSC